MRCYWYSRIATTTTISTTHRNHRCQRSKQNTADTCDKRLLELRSWRWYLADIRASVRHVQTPLPSWETAVLCHSPIIMVLRLLSSFTHLSAAVRALKTFRDRGGFCWWGPRANIEDGSSLIIHWSSGSHKWSANWANQYDIYFGGAPTGGGPGPWPPWTP